MEFRIVKTEFLRGLRLAPLTGDDYLGVVMPMRI
jgi:hypothetical protein